jgi:hypothetical protein
MLTSQSTTMSKQFTPKRFARPATKQLLPFLFSLLSLSAALPALAQPSASKSFSYDTAGIHVVQIAIPGTLTIRAGSGSAVTGTYTVQASGRVWGISNKGDSFFTNVRSFTSHDTLFIEATENRSWAIGFSTYEERLETTINIPRHLAAGITRVQNMFIAGELRKLTAVCSENIRMSCAAPGMGILRCQAKYLYINESRKNPDYEYQGPGTAQYSLYASNINCYLSK